MTIEILNESGSAVDEPSLVSVARHVLARMGVSPLAELSISLQDAAEMTRLHLHYMDLPGPTDVLSFPQDDLDLRGALGVSQGAIEPEPDLPPTLLGDVVLCPEFAAGQAVTAGHSLAEELQLLTTHGVLHLLGYDHEEPEEHEQMFSLQAELLASWRSPSGAPPGPPPPGT